MQTISPQPLFTFSSFSEFMLCVLFLSLVIAFIYKSNNLPMNDISQMMHGAIYDGISYSQHPEMCITPPEIRTPGSPISRVS